MSVQFNPRAAASNFVSRMEQPPQYTREEFEMILGADSDDEAADNTDLSKDWRTLSEELDAILKDCPATQETLVETFMGLYSRYLPKNQVKIKETWWLFMQDILPVKGVDGLVDFYAALNQAPNAQEIIKASKFATLFGIK